MFVEYVLLAGVNDSRADATALAAALDSRAFKVNLIPYNPTGLYEGSSRDAIERFKAVLDSARIPATVRLTRGRDIEAACGQLAVAQRNHPGRHALPVLLTVQISGGQLSRRRSLRVTVTR